jgi:hypothetical protein
MKTEIKINTLENQMKQVNEKLDDLDVKIDKGFRDLKEELCNYVRREEFTTVKSIVYGMVGAVLTAFIGGLIYLVFK